MNLIPKIREGEVRPLQISTSWLCAGWYRNEGSRFRLVMRVRISRIREREAEDFDTLNLVRELVADWLYLRFRWRANHIGGRRMYFNKGIATLRMQLLKVVREHVWT